MTCAIFRLFRHNKSEYSASIPWADELSCPNMATESVNIEDVDALNDHVAAGHNIVAIDNTMHAYR
jgi:hypothetical protein